MMISRKHHDLGKYNASHIVVRLLQFPSKTCSLEGYNSKEIPELIGSRWVETCEDRLLGIHIYGLSFPFQDMLSAVCFYQFAIAYQRSKTVVAIVSLVHYHKPSKTGRYCIFFSKIQATISSITSFLERNNKKQAPLHSRLHGTITSNIFIIRSTIELKKLSIHNSMVKLMVKL